MIARHGFLMRKSLQGLVFLSSFSSSQCWLVQKLGSVALLTRSWSWSISAWSLTHMRVSVEILGLTVSQRVYFTPFSFLCFVTQADKRFYPLTFSFCCKFLSLLMKNLQKSYESKSNYEYSFTTLACISQLSWHCSHKVVPIWSFFLQFDCYFVHLVKS